MFIGGLLLLGLRVYCLSLKYDSDINGSMAQPKVNSALWNQNGHFDYNDDDFFFLNFADMGT